MTLAVDVVALAPVPPFDNSSMDGFALRAADVAKVPMTLTLRTTRQAGDDDHGAAVLAAGHCDAVMTGAALPAGADTVVPFEVVQSHDEMHVTLAEPVTEGAFVRRTGEDVSAGDLVAPAGATMTSQALAALVACGVREVEVVRRPRVAVITTGRELIDTGATSIPDSNSVYLGLALARSFVVTTVPAVGDEVDAIADALRWAAAEHDAVITTGGVGPGAGDLLPTAGASVGHIERRSVAMKPGKPFAFGHVSDGDRQVPLFCLPGNPVSAMVSLNVLCLPALRRLAGERHDADVLIALAGTDFTHPGDGKTHFVPARLAYENGAPVARTLGADGSHKVATAAAANCLVVLPDGEGRTAGQTVTVQTLLG